LRVRFGAYVLDTDVRQLTSEGAPLHLSPKAFDLLTLLVEQRPAVVDKASIRERLWPGVHVVDATLSNLVVEIRNALKDRPSSPAFVRTVHGVGYAFAGEAVAVDDERPGGPARAADPSRPTPFWVVWKDRPIVLTSGDNVMGRDAACAVWLDADGVSRRHACIRVPVDDAESGVTIEDLSSTNGTFVGGRRVTAARPLAHGDRIRMGRATIVFRAWKAEDAPTKRVAPPKGRA